MFVVEQGEYPIIETKTDFRRWSWPLIISVLANLVLFYVLTYIIYLKNDEENTATVLQIVLLGEKVKTEPKEATKTVKVKQSEIKPQILKPDIPRKDTPKVVPQKFKKKIIESKVKESLSPKAVVEQLMENRETVETRLQENIELVPQSITKMVKPVPLFRLTSQPSGIKGEPVYPEHARALGREAYVMASIIIDIDGKVLEVQIVESGGEEFDEAVTQWLLKQQLNPGFVSDKPVVSKINQPFSFKLR